MHSSRNSSDRPVAPERAPVPVREGGAAYLPGARDPFGALVELMEVVEALCLRWPARTPFPREASFRL